MKFVVFASFLAVICAELDPNFIDRYEQCDKSSWPKDCRADLSNLVKFHHAVNTLNQAKEAHEWASKSFEQATAKEAHKWASEDRIHTIAIPGFTVNTANLLSATIALVLVFFTAIMSCAISVHFLHNGRLALSL